MSASGIVALVAAVLGSVGLWTFRQWRLDRRRQEVRRDELSEIVEQALADSPTIKDMSWKTAKDIG